MANRRPVGGVLRHSVREAPYLYRFEDIEFDGSAMVLRVAGTVVSVERVPLELLKALLRRPNEVLTHGELQQAVWEDRVTVPHVLASAINKLRRALGPSGSARIQTHPRLGYRFAGDLDRMALGRTPSVPLSLASGQPVDERRGLRLHRRLDPGKSIEVWLARDPQLRISRVFKFASGGEDLASLKREFTVYRALLAELGPRDDFVRIVSSNFSSAPYFLESEYGGDDLVAWAAEKEQLSSMPRPDRIALFLQVARAVAAAHGVGILHKDLKPANVLIRESSTGWLVQLGDFGNSRILEPGQLARLGITAMGMTISDADPVSALSGTPLYLAPELLSGKSPTLRSDLYALGIMLYQTLVADFRRPMTTGWQRDIDDELLVEDLTATTEGQPEERLNSVGELVTRLSTLEQRRADRARLAQESLIAAEATARLARLRSRRPWAVAATAIAALGIASCLWLYSQARTAQMRAEQETARAQAINDFLTKDVLQAADVMRLGTTRTVSMFEGLQKASASASQRFAAQPATEASVRRQIGEVYLHLNHATDARHEFDRARTLLEGRVAANDPELLAVRFDAVRCLVGRFMSTEALAELSSVESVAGPAALRTDTPLALEAFRTRVEVLMDAQKNSEALPAALRLVELTDHLPNVGNNLRFEARERLSEIYLQLEDRPKADALLAQLMMPPFGESQVSAVLYARLKLQLGRQRINDGRLDDAERLLTDVRDTLSTAFGPKELHVGLAESELADLLQTRGDFAAAAAACRAAIDAFETSLGPAHSYVNISKANLGLIELELGEPAHALQLLDGTRPTLLAIAHSGALITGVDFGRARALNALGRPAEAMDILKSIDAAALGESSWGPRDAAWELQAETAVSLIRLGRRDVGTVTLKAAIAGLESAGSHPWLIARYKDLLARRPERPGT